MDLMPSKRQGRSSLGSSSSSSPRSPPTVSGQTRCPQRHRGRSQHGRTCLPAALPAAAATAGEHAATALPRRVQEVAVLGGEDFIYSQMSGVSEELFKGSVLGVNADIASVDYRQSELRSLSHLPDDFAPPARFLDRVALHVAKNLLAGQEGVSLGQVPLVLGIWGHKGAGKSFNLELCCKRLDVQPIIISAGELEDELAGEPGRRLRERYRFAARYSASTGVATCLIINDLDAGVGRFANTDSTINNQNVQGTLMAICDDPNKVSAGQDWAAARRSFPRVPIFITANDLRFLYAPLVREGRMEKFYFTPTRAESLELLSRLLEPLTPAQAATLLDAFPRQPLDFFGAIKNRLTDDAVSAWLNCTPLEGLGEALLGTALMYANDPGAWRGRQQVTITAPVTLSAALQAGHELAREQQHVLDHNLVREYFRYLEPTATAAADPPSSSNSSSNSSGAQRSGSRHSVVAAQAPRPARPPPPTAPPTILTDDMQRYWSYLAGNANVTAQQAAGPTAEEQAASAQQQQTEAAEAVREQEERAMAARGWRSVAPTQVHAALRTGAAAVLDVRSVREWDWGKIKGAVHCPAVLTTGSSMRPVTTANPDFVHLVANKFPDRSRPLVLYGTAAGGAAGDSKAEDDGSKFVSKVPTLGSGTEDFVAGAVAALLAAGFSDVSELSGGYRAWDLEYRPDGRRRERGTWADKSSGELEWWTASN